MILYQVTLTINPIVRTAFNQWLEQHVSTMLTFSGFQSAQILHSQQNADEVIVQYWLDNDKSLQHYFDHHAKAMRDDGLKQFGGQFSATRNVANVAFEAATMVSD